MLQAAPASQWNGAGEHCTGPITLATAHVLSGHAQLVATTSDSMWDAFMTEQGSLVCCLSAQSLASDLWIESILSSSRGTIQDSLPCLGPEGERALPQNPPGGSTPCLPLHPCLFGGLGNTSACFSWLVTRPPIFPGLTSSLASLLPAS